MGRLGVAVRPIGSDDRRADRIPARRNPQRLLGPLALAAGLLVVLTSCIGVVLAYSPVPYWDQWYGGIGWYMRAEDDWWAAFWSQHNEHRLLFSRLIFWIDIRFFGGINRFDLAANMATCGTMAAALYFATVERAGFGRMRRTVTAGLVLVVCFSWTQRSNFTWGFQNQWFAVNAFALASFLFLCRAGARSRAVVWVTLSMASGVAAAFSMANGLIVLPVCLVVAIIIRAPISTLATVALVTAATWAAYFAQSGTSTGSLPNGTLSYALRHSPIALVEWSLLYLGSPMWFVFGSRSLALAAGSCVCIGGAVIAMVCRPLRGTPALPLLAMALFLIGTAVVTAGGRLPFGVANVFQDRYATNGLLAIYCVAAYAIINAWPLTTRAWLGGLMTAPLVGLLVAQISAFDVDWNEIFQRNLAGIALRVGALDNDSIGVLSDGPDYLRSIVPRARSEHLSIFADDAFGFAPRTNPIVATSSCQGSIDIVADTPTNGVMSATGWIYDPVSRTIPRAIVLADRDGHVIGEGLSGLDRPDVGRYLGSGRTRFGWKGYFKGDAKPARLFGVRGGTYCEVS